MKATKEKQQFPFSTDGTSCSICLEAVEGAGKRSVARLRCSHLFHLDCIGSAFNAKGAMQCPNCRQVEGGQWLYASGSSLHQDDFARNDYARIQFDVAYLHNERHVESFDGAHRWSTRSHGHDVGTSREGDPLINPHLHPAADGRRLQGQTRYPNAGETHVPHAPGFDRHHAALASEMARFSARSVEARPLHPDIRPSHASAMYVQSGQRMMPRSSEVSYERSLLPEVYPSHMLDRPAGFRRQMHDDGFEEQSMYNWQVERMHSARRVPIDGFNTIPMHGFPDFGLHGRFQQSNIGRTEVIRDGHLTRRAGPYYPYVSNGIGGFGSGGFSDAYEPISSELGHGDDRFEQVQW